MSLTGCWRRWSAVARTVLVVTAALWAGATLPTYGQAQFRTDSQTCREVVNHILHGRHEAATDVIEPDAETREFFAEMNKRMAGSFSALTRGLPPRLEQTFPDELIDRHPLSVQLWSFGETEKYFIGCLLVFRDSKSWLVVKVSSISAGEVIDGTRADFARRFGPPTR